MRDVARGLALLGNNTNVLFPIDKHLCLRALPRALCSSISLVE